LDGVLNVPNITVHTAEDEQNELASLSIAELAEIQSDVNGLTALVQPFHLEAMNLPLALVAFDQVLSDLPASETAAYHRAVQLCPDQVAYERKLIFVEHEHGDVRLAAKAMAGYWTHRVRLFGPDKAFLPMTLSGAMKDEAMSICNRRVWEMVPVPDTAGRTIFYHAPCRRDFSQYSAEQEMRAMWYFFETVIEDANRRKNGVVILADMRNHTICQYSLAFSSAFSPILSVLPTRVRAVHWCCPNPIVNALLPISKTLMDRRLRMRIIVHQSPPLLLASLNRYCIAINSIPTDLGVGGSAILNTNGWLLNRIAIENSRHVRSTALLPATATSAAPAPAAAAAAVFLSQHAATSQPIVPAAVQSSIEQVARMASSKQPGSQTFASSSNIIQGMKSPKESTPCQDEFAHLSDRDLYEHIMKERRRTGVGRKADPRMDNAVLACLGDSNLSRMDALTLSGFEFVARGSSSNSNGQETSIQQRRDQLNRRLRQAQVEFFVTLPFVVFAWLWPFVNNLLIYFRFISPFLYAFVPKQAYIKAARNGSQKYASADPS